MRYVKSILLAAALALIAQPAHAASGKTQGYKNGIVNQFFRSVSFTFPSTLSVRLYSACPDGSGGSGTELSGNGYAKQDLNPGATNWGLNGTNANATAGALSNISAVTYPTVTTSAWTVNCVALTDSAGTTMYYWGNVTSAPVTVNVGATASFASNALVITEAALGVPDLSELVALLGRPVTVEDLVLAWAEQHRIAVASN